MMTVKSRKRSRKSDITRSRHHLIDRIPTSDNLSDQPYAPQSAVPSLGQGSSLFQTTMAGVENIYIRRFRPSDLSQVRALLLEGFVTSEGSVTVVAQRRALLKPPSLLSYLLAGFGVTLLSRGLNTLTASSGHYSARLDSRSSWLSGTHKICDPSASRRSSPTLATSRSTTASPARCSWPHFEGIKILCISRRW
ncbi:hypothetical protein FB45DRAFT_923927 [Roridomyces roridus]|uniref:Uncharacterized protein n=1 Tax=Roridomyces roridus TaxID=1738132 RepID=A0AAD7FKQ4_9AGAR|nr:hypothetical protein FB45DRAFT_923927 [Roridomyces roridus]